VIAEINVFSVSEQTFIRGVSNCQSQVEISGENYCIKNKLFSIFVVNDTKELSDCGCATQLK